jgi:hypothetical protein
VIGVNYPRKCAWLLFLPLLAANVAFGAGWDAIGRIPAGQRIEITARDGTSSRATFVSATGEALVLRESSGERSVKRAELRRVRVYDPGRRWRRGLMWIAIGAGAGAGIGEAACPGCPNEGHGYKYVGPGAAAGAGIGALGFLSSPYRTVYKNK